MHKISFLLMSVAVVVSGCASSPLSSSVPYDESKLLAKPCSFKPDRDKDANAWFALIQRDPDPSDAYATGTFGARMRLWITYAGDQTELVTVNAGPTDQRVRIPGKKAIVAVSADQCEAFEPRA